MVVDRPRSSSRSSTASWPPASKKTSLAASLSLCSIIAVALASSVLVRPSPRRCRVSSRLSSSSTLAALAIVMPLLAPALTVAPVTVSSAATDVELLVRLLTSFCSASTAAEGDAAAVLVGADEDGAGVGAVGDAACGEAADDDAAGGSVPGALARSSPEPWCSSTAVMALAAPSIARPVATAAVRWGGRQPARWRGGVLLRRGIRRSSRTQPGRACDRRPEWVIRDAGPTR